ncbi:hypothetical protein Ddc_20769 [Ditylenchus destructor]|nr:hypothetical protein Ddc_20769 [Ditylenchus destructor]
MLQRAPGVAQQQGSQAYINFWMDQNGDPGDGRNQDALATARHSIVVKRRMPMSQEDITKRLTSAFNKVFEAQEKKFSNDEFFMSQSFGGYISQTGTDEVIDIRVNAEQSDAYNRVLIRTNHLPEVYAKVNQLETAKKRILHKAIGFPKEIPKDIKKELAQEQEQADDVRKKQKEMDRVKKERADIAEKNRKRKQAEKTESDEAGSTYFTFKLRRSPTTISSSYEMANNRLFATITMESETLSDIPGDILVDIFRFMNRKDLSNIALGNRRWRDISRTHFAQYPLLLLGELSIAKNVFGKREPGLKIDYRWIDMEDDSRGMKDDSVAFNHLVTVNWPPLSNPAPAYLRFEKVDITAFHLFEKYPQEYTFTVRKLLDILKNLQTAFVDSELFFGSGPSLGEPFTTRRSLLQFLKVDILPLFPSCREYVLVGLNLEGSEENESEREHLLLLPELYDSEAKIVLVFTFNLHLGDQVVLPSAKNTFAVPMISIQEVITWLHRPNPEDPSKKRELILRDETFSYDESLQANAIKEIKHRLLEVSFIYTL